MLSQQSSSSQSTDPGVRRGLSPNDVYVLVISCIAVIINITEAVLYKKRQLKPSRYLATNIIKTAPWAAILIIDIVAAALSNNISYGRLAVAISLIIIVAIFLLFLGSLIYASVIFHRSRKARLGKYHSPEAAVGIQASLSDEIHK
ncbi:MAG: hypothetical protein M1812_003660 [Candelaria pacifica]|nr:MAG: hypothetical protein M1812_003660 [Candelaria pacifica]